MDPYGARSANGYLREKVRPVYLGFEWAPPDVAACELRVVEGDCAAGELRAAEVATVERGACEVNVTTHHVVGALGSRR